MADWQATEMEPVVVVEPRVVVERPEKTRLSRALTPARQRAKRRGVKVNACRFAARLGRESTKQDSGRLAKSRSIGRLEHSER